MIENLNYDSKLTVFGEGRGCIVRVYTRMTVFIESWKKLIALDYLPIITSRSRQ